MMMMMTCLTLRDSIICLPIIRYGDSFTPQERLLDIIEFIRSSHRKYMGLERDLAVDTELDPRVDGCLYFVPPHRLKQIDLEFMRQLSRICPLIPLIAKADSMTTHELSAFRSEIKTRAKAFGVEFFKFPATAFDAANIRKDARDFPPFAVVSSERTAVLESGTFWPVREYQWGTCEAFNRMHSDCSVLKTLLLEHGFHDLKKDSHRYYTAYRTQRMRPGLLASWGRAIDVPFLQCLIAVSPFLHPKMAQCLHTDYASSSLVTTTELPEEALQSDPGYILPPDPMGHWRYSLCDCKNLLLCLFGWCLPCLPLAQLYEKMVSAGTFLNVVLLFCAMVTVRYILTITASALGITAFTWFVWMMNLMVQIVMIFAAVRIRKAIRLKYGIHEQCCGTCEDCCCAWCCMPCVIAQMWTHVNDPQRTQASIISGFSEVGLPSDFNPNVWYPDRAFDGNDESSNPTVVVTVSTPRGSKTNGSYTAAAPRSVVVVDQPEESVKVSSSDFASGGGRGGGGRGGGGACRGGGGGNPFSRNQGIPNLASVPLSDGDGGDGELRSRSTFDPAASANKEVRSSEPGTGV
jgi:Cys-rich protein (TIGR01571 family)